MILQGSDIVVSVLVEQGVDTVFGYPGGTVVDIYDALYRHADKVRHILVGHEQHAAHAADGYARATGRVGVCIATSGPGATNLVTGIATAHLDSTPLVAITGNVATTQIGTDSFQEIDITGVTLPITKHNYFVSDVAQLAPTLREAFCLARSGRPGPVLVDIAKDVQTASCDYEPRPPLPVPAPKAAPAEQVVRIAEELSTCNRPFIYVGGGMVASGAEGEVLALADALDAPIGCSLMGVSGIPSDHPRFVGMQGMHGHYTSSLAMYNADLILALGVRFNDRSTGDRFKFARSARIVRVDIDASELSKTVADDADLLGDLRLTLDELLPQVAPRERPEWRGFVKRLRARERELADTRGGLTPANVMRALDARLTPDTPVVTDVGQHQMWAAQHLHRSVPRTFITSGGLGTMGFGMGAAIGAAIATGARPVLVIGDGGLAMCAGELATAVANRVPLAILLLNNGVLGMVRQWQTLFYEGRHSATDLAPRGTDWVALAQAYGAQAARARDLAELEVALDEALSCDDGPYLVECPIDPDELVLPMMPSGGSMEDLIVKVGD